MALSGRPYDGSGRPTALTMSRRRATTRVMGCIRVNSLVATHLIKFPKVVHSAIAKLDMRSANSLPLMPSDEPRYIPSSEGVYFEHFTNLTEHIWTTGKQALDRDIDTSQVLNDD